MTFKYYYNIDKNGNVVNFNESHGDYEFDYDRDMDESVVPVDTAQEVAEFIGGGYVSTTSDYYKAIRDAIKCELINPDDMFGDEEWVAWKKSKYLGDARRECIEERGE
jgi:hypothetical protein